MKIIKPKIIKKKLEKICSICGKKIKVISFPNHSYKGGHYFGKIPISTKSEWAKVMKLGTKASTICGQIFQVLKKDPKPYKHIEYWECPKCYWGK